MASFGPQVTNPGMTIGWNNLNWFKLSKLMGVIASTERQQSMSQPLSTHALCRTHFRCEHAARFE